MEYVNVLIVVTLSLLSLTLCSEIGNLSKKCQDTFQNQMLLSHNSYRSKHLAPSLGLDSNVSKAALDKGKNLASNIQTDSNINNYGRNLAYFSFSQPNDLDNCEWLADKFAEMWYKERNKYNYNSTEFSKFTGSFTQMIWKDTKKIGCGLALANNVNKFTTVYGVCYYNPSGNVQGKFLDNVLPESKS